MLRLLESINTTLQKHPLKVSSASLTGREGGLLRDRKGSIHVEASKPGMISKQSVSDESLIAPSLQKTHLWTSEQSLST
jgi:hypothetical protein